MNNPRKFIDTSKELQLHRYKNGIRLVEPDQFDFQNTSSMYNSGHTVGSILKSDFGVYFYNTQNEFQNINIRHVEACGFNSIKKSIGKTVRETAIRESADNLISHNNTILKTQKSMIFMEEIKQINGTYNNGISIKLPWYDHHDRVIGLFGCTMIIGAQSLADSLTKISQLGILSPYIMDHRQLHSSKSEIENSCNASYSFSIAQNLNIRLTNRQMECIHLLMKGMTAKDIANELHLSFRTVESYLANIKNRLKCKNKTELIIKLARIFDV